MRLLLRIAIFWLITLPLFYAFGLPKLLSMLSEKVRADGYTECLAQLKQQNIIDTPAALVKHEVGEHYCHCVTDGLTLTKADLPDLVQRRMPQRVADMQKPVIDACNKELQERVNGIITGAPAPRVTRKDDGTEIMYFDSPPPKVIYQR